MYLKKHFVKWNEQKADLFSALPRSSLQSFPLGGEAAEQKFCQTLRK